ncbi:MAG: ABC transporter substrate-binding protein [Eubacteriales bacterium]|nr:ABC transporter substrate-binding protein [Eubacteriales bacterium]
MKRIKHLLPLLLVIALLMPFFAFAGENVPVIGILQYVQHGALDLAREGFLKSLEEQGYVDKETIIIDYQNGQADQSTCASIADKFVADKVDLMLGIATPAVLALAGKTETIPILGTAVTDYVEARLAASNEKPGFNISGTTDMNPIKDQIAMIKHFVPEARIVGLIYTGSEINSTLQADIAKEEIVALGMDYTEVTVNNSNDVQQAMLSLVDNCDVIYIPTDNVLAASMPIVAEVALEARRPVICGDAGMVKEGGQFTLAIDYYKLGEQTGLMAGKLLRGEAEAVGDMPIESQSEYSYYVNKTLCDAIGLAIPEDMLPYAEETH